MTTVTFKTARAQYQYEVHSIHTSNWNSVAGNYVFAKQLPSGQYQALYIGQTNDFKARFAAHEKLQLAFQNGANYILVHLNPSEQLRKAEEADLVGWISPPLNTLLK